MSTKNVLTPYIKSLLLDPPNLTPEDLSTVLRLIVQGVASDIQMASFFTALKIKGLDHQSPYIAAAAQTLLEFSNVVDPNDVDSAGYIDIVGTGGDGQNTFNVSTSSAIVAAGMGLNICKHGGKASTSSSGAGDLLKCLGADLMKVTDKTTPSIVAKSNFCFLFAPAFHPGMAKVAPVRANLGIPSIFNILGPLLNPVPLRARIIGVYSESLGQVFAEAVHAMNKSVGREKTSATMIVWGECGLDEISPIGRTKIWVINNDTEEIETSYIEPADFGLAEHPLKQVSSGTPQENADLLLKILRNELPLDDPVVEYILMNSAALAVVSGLAVDWKDGVKYAKESIQSGAALSALQNFIDCVTEV